MGEDRDLQSKLTRRDDIVIWLAQHYDAIQVKVFLEVLDGVKQCAANKLRERADHQTRLSDLDGELQRLQLRCSHPLTWHDNGGQYTKVTTWCSICGAEL